MLLAYDPESYVSTNSTTGANMYELICHNSARADKVLALRGVDFRQQLRRDPCTDAPRGVEEALRHDISVWN